MKCFWYKIYWVSIVAADALVLQHQGISSHSVDQHLIVSHQESTVLGVKSWTYVMEFTPIQHTHLKPCWLDRKMKVPLLLFMMI